MNFYAGVAIAYESCEQYRSLVSVKAENKSIAEQKVLQMVQDAWNPDQGWYDHDVELLEIPIPTWQESAIIYALFVIIGMSLGAGLWNLMTWLL